MTRELTGFVYCLIASGPLEGFQHLHMDLTLRFPKLASQTLSFRGYQFLPKSRPIFANKLRKPKISCPQLTSDNTADFRDGTWSWSEEKVHTFLKTWGEENNLKIKTQAASITGYNLWHLLPSELAFLFTPDHTRSSLAYLDKFEQLEQLGQKLFDKLHPFADQNADVSLWSFIKVSNFLKEFASRHNLNVKSLPKITGRMLMDYNVDRLSQLFVNADQQAVLDLYNQLLSTQRFSIRPSKESQSDHSADVELLKSEFSATYIDPSNVVSAFGSYVEDCSRMYRTQYPAMFAPYIAVVQASGSGKTRLLREVSRSVCTLYVCCRIGTRGYPPRTKDAIEYLFRKLDNYETYEGCLDELVKRLRRAEMAALLYLSQAEYDSSATEFASEQLSQRIWTSNELESNGVPINPGKLVLLVFDEARWLLDIESSGGYYGMNLFRLLQRALIALWDRHKDSRLFAVFVDTPSRISNFVPSLKQDPSARAPKAGLSVGRESFHPYILTDTFDVLFEAEKLPKGTRDLTPLLELKNEEKYLLAGRPLVAKPSGTRSAQSAFLLSKLYGGATPFQEQSTYGHLSTVLIRLAISISSQSPAAADLVAGYMVYLLTTDLKREDMCVSHLAEPRLAEAAALGWNRDDALIEHLIPALRRALMSGKVNTGKRAQIVAQIVILTAFDTACKLSNKEPGSLVPLTSVLQQLLPLDSDINVLDAIPASLHDVSVACGQFVQLSHNFDLDTSTRLAERHCGAAFKDWQTGLDFVVPLIAKFSALLLFQIKALSDQEKECEASFESVVKMRPSSALADGRIPRKELAELDKNCVRVYMQVGAMKGSAICNDGPLKAVGPQALQIFGLSSRCLCKRLKASLQNLLYCESDLETKVLEQLAVKRFIPFPQDVERLRQNLPFIIDEYPHWSDLRREDLLHACRKFGIRGMSKRLKYLIVERLEREKPGGCREFRIWLASSNGLDWEGKFQAAAEQSTDSEADGSNELASYYSVKQLRDICRELQLSNFSKLKKEDLMKKIEQESPGTLKSRSSRSAL